MSLSGQSNAVLRIGFGPVRRVPYFGRHLLAGVKGALEYLPIVEWREVRLPSDAREQDRYVCAEICGDSLVDALIADGDLAVIELAAEARDGELVAALTPEGILAKFFYREPGGVIRLESRNEAYPNLRYPARRVRIQGVIRHIIRRLS
jgi:SOS-response transcriptional repressor LexA